MTMASSGCSRDSSLSMVGMKSSATVQQMQPLVSSTISPGAQALAAHSSTRPPSKPASPNSLTMTAMRRPPASAQQGAEQRGLAGAEKAGQHGDGNTIHGETFSCDGLTLEPERKPGRDKDDIGNAAATAWLRRPWASRKRRPSGVSGTRPRPISLDTSTTGWLAHGAAIRPDAAVSVSTSRSACMMLESHSVRQSTSTARSAALSRASAGTSSSGSSTVVQPSPRAGAMMRDAGLHFVVARRGGGEIDPLQRAAPRSAARQTPICRTARRPAPGWWRVRSFRRGPLFGARPSSGDQASGGTRAIMPLRSTSARSRHGTRPKSDFW